MPQRRHLQPLRPRSLRATRRRTPIFASLPRATRFGLNGSALYTGRTRLDAASLDRFVVIEVGYDRRIDLLCAGGDRELVAFFEAYRAAFAEMGMPVVASYRSERQIQRHAAGHG